MADHADIDVLDDVLRKLELVVAGVRADQLDNRTSCPDFDVRRMLDHIVGYLRRFAAAAQGGSADFDPAQVHSDDPAADVRTAGAETVRAWRELGTDRKVSLMGPGMPGEMLLGMTIIEYVTHGSELALASDQQIPFTDDEFAVALARAEASLTDQFRGEGKPFGHRVDVPVDAPVRERFLAFMGRRVPVG